MFGLGCVVGVLLFFPMEVLMLKLLKGVLKFLLLLNVNVIIIRV
jgi:hypothetical protein